jgi:hypothetical protein
MNNFAAFIKTSGCPQNGFGQGHLGKSNIKDIMQPKLIITFEKLSEPAFDAKSDLIYVSLTGNVNFPLPWPAPVPQLPDILAAKTDYHAKFEAAQSGDSVKISARIDARDALTTLFKKLAPYLELIADGNVTMLETTGYDLRHDIVQPVTPNPLPAPTGFNFVRGDVSGTMTAWADSLPGAGSYILQTCTGDPAVEANWKTKTTSLHCSNIITDSYTPGTIYYARLCGIGTNGSGVWAVSPGVMAA